MIFTNGIEKTTHLNLWLENFPVQLAVSEIGNIIINAESILKETVHRLT